MGTVVKKLFIFAEDKQDAVNEIMGYLDDMTSDRFFDGYEILEDTAVRGYELPEGYKYSGQKDMEQKLQSLYQDMAGFWGNLIPLSTGTAVNTSILSGMKQRHGSAMIEAGNILAEKFCRGMPYFNLDSWDYEQCDKDQWSVEVRFWL